MMMDARERDVLASLQFGAAPTERTLWAGRLAHVNGLNQSVYDRVQREISALRPSVVDSPPGLVVHGEFGSGKSHLVWWARRFIAGTGGYYFNIQPDGNVSTLWTRVLASMVHDLSAPIDVDDDPASGSITQLSLVVGRLATAVGLPETAREVLSGARKVETAQLHEHLDEFTDRISAGHPSRDLRNVALALALLAVRNDDARAAAWEYLHGSDEEMDTRRTWGLRPVKPGAPDVMVRHLSDLLAMTGPSLFVIDQIDDLVVRSSASTEMAASAVGDDDLASALMTIREKFARSIMLISCLDHTWRMIRGRASRSAHDRFHEALHLEPIPNPDVGRQLIARYLAPQFDQLNFRPPYETWPVPVEAFASVKGFRPRRLIQAVGAYVRACAVAGELLPMTELRPAEAVRETEPAHPEIDRVHDRYLDHQRSVILDSLKETSAEKHLAGVLTAAVRALTVEIDLGADFLVRDNCRGADIPSTHCEVATPTGKKVFLRGVNTVKASAVGSRLDKARAVAYAESESDSQLLIVRTNPWGQTPRVLRASEEVSAANGIIIDIGDDDLRTLCAVQLTTTGDSAEVQDWLRHRRPVSATALGAVLIRLINPGDGGGLAVTDLPQLDDPARRLRADDVAAETDSSCSGDVPSSDAIPLGLTADGQALDVDLAALRKHVAVFASSGSGKTVLLRRIIEECALRGVSTIVLDPNNDLARLGDPWPSHPQGWWPGDAERARDYLECTDVVVWTPGVSKGNPLTLQAFPDFTAVRDDPDELRLAVETAVASLAPRARISGESHAADGRRAVLRETLLDFARRGGGDLEELIALLQDPPENVLVLPSAVKHADYVASALSYARSNDPLFDGDGTPFDPDGLLTPADGRRARVSVINLAGIPDENRPAFINRLQMALFSWIKRHPARDKPLSGLFVMDEAQTFIPSDKGTPCTESTRNLASQARKYGLGLVYATQAPRGIDSRITGNAASHIYGRVTVAAHVGAVNGMARARGEEPPRIAGLTTGRFYASLEGRPLVEMTVPMCLSHHGSPLEEAEIAERAQTRR